MFLNHPLLGIALRIQARQKGKLEEVKAALRSAHGSVMESVEDLAVQRAEPAELLAMTGADSPGVVGASGGILQALLAFVGAHWADILAIIMKLLPKSTLPLLGMPEIVDVALGRLKQVLASVGVPQEYVDQVDRLADKADKLVHLILLDGPDAVKAFIIVEIAKLDNQPAEPPAPPAEPTPPPEE